MRRTSAKTHERIDRAFDEQIAAMKEKEQAADSWQPVFSPWRHGGWYVDNLRYPSGAVGCVSRNYDDRKWRIVCDPRPFKEQPTFPNRTAAAFGERDLIAQQAATAARLEYRRTELRAERISYGELHELQSLAQYIDPGDVELLEAAGVPEDEPTKPIKFGSGRATTEFSREVNAPDNDAANNECINCDAPVEREGQDCGQCSSETPSWKFRDAASNPPAAPECPVCGVLSLQPCAHPQEPPAATARPWRVSHEKDDPLVGPIYFIRSTSGPLAVMTGSESAIDAALIVQAVNSFDAMRDALRGAQSALRKAMPFLPPDKEAIYCGEWLDEINEVLAIADSVNGPSTEPLGK